jgi:excisionase family DNA binding protein
MPEKADNIDDDDLLTIDEAAAKLRVGRGKIYELGREKRLELVKFDRGRRVTARSVKKLIRDLIRNSRDTEAVSRGGRP